MNHVVIIPVHNEEEFLDKVLESLVLQINRPKLVMLVDDNSNDNTPIIIERYVREYSWIKSIKSELKPNREVGSKVVQVFNCGLEKIDLSEYDLISKLDSDITLPENYYKIIESNFNINPNLALTGGQCTIKEGSQWVLEKVSGLDHVRGALKTYRVDCFKTINGMLPVMDWDTIDEFMLRFEGYEVKTIEDLYVKHHRPTDSASKWLKISKLSAKSFGELGYSLFFGFALCIEKSYKKKPFFLAGFSQFGYFIYYKFISPQKKVIPSKLSEYIANYRYNNLRNKFKRKIRFK